MDETSLDRLRRPIKTAGASADLASEFFFPISMMRRRDRYGAAVICTGLGSQSRFCGPASSHDDLRQLIFAGQSICRPIICWTVRFIATIDRSVANLCGAVMLALYFSDEVRECPLRLAIGAEAKPVQTAS
jgi:hypothetical protein